jgi:hypothetical protein
MALSCYEGKLGSVEGQNELSPQPTGSATGGWQGE